MLASIWVVCGSHVISGSSSSLASSMVDSATKTLASKPVDLFVKDVYPHFVRRGMVNLYQSLKAYYLTLAYGDVEDVSDMVMEKLRQKLFGTRRVQVKAWNTLRNKFRDYLRLWWFSTPYDPMDALKMGVWQAMLKLAADDMPAVLGGTPEYDRLKKLVLDANSTVINRWVEEIQAVMMGGVVRKQNEGRPRRSSDGNKNKKKTGRGSVRALQRSRTR